jgi:hypothetical protein
MLLRRTGTLFALVSLAVAPAFAAEFQPIKQQATTAHYRLELQIGPMQKISVPADVTAGRVKDGEVIVRGIAATPKDTGTARHLEVHVYALDKNTRVPDANVTIIVTDAGRKTVNVPIAVMYGVADGPSNTHYGNNASLPEGSYTIDVTANGEKSTFKIVVPAA